MKADLFSGEASMRSPTVTINDSCVRIYYYFNNDKCVLNVYAGAQKKLCLDAINTEEWMIGQFYIENAEISIKFEAVKISDDDKACEVEIQMVEVTDGKCEPLGKYRLFRSSFIQMEYTYIIYIYIYIYIYISFNWIGIFCQHIFLLILSYCHIDFIIFGVNWLMYLP